MAQCSTCRGTRRCPECHGRGLTGGMLPVNCKTCRGKKVCFACDGKGTR